MGKALSSSEYMKNKICETLSCNDCSKSEGILKYYGGYEEYKKSLVVNNCFDNRGGREKEVGMMTGIRYRLEREPGMMI